MAGDEEKDAELERLRFPIGRAQVEPDLSAARVRELLDQMASVPARVRAAATALSERALDTPYRPGGWTARQVVHHLPDSHMNAYVRFKLTATEDEPAVRVYQEAEWAKLADSAGPVAVSLALLEALHERWVGWMRTLDERAWRRIYVHPQNGRVTLLHGLQIYAWHGDHHLAHIRAAAERARA